MDPAITVLVPFRDSIAFIGESLESIGEQSFRNMEVLLVDDGCDDGSGEAARGLCASDHRFRVIPCEGHGVVDALNTGLRRARGEWIARHDSDDLSLPERLHLQHEEALGMGSRSVVTCRVRSFREGGLRRGYRLYERWLNGLTSHEEIERNIFVESPIPHPTAFYNREAVLKAGGYRHGDFPEDYELWLRLWSLGFRFRRVPDVLVRWRDHERRLSRTDPRYSLTSFYRLKASYLGGVPCLRERRVIVWGSGQTGRRLSGFLLREGFEIEAFITVVPSRVGGKLRGAPIVGPDGLSALAGIPVLIASRAPGARRRICDHLDSAGLLNWRDYVVCA